MTAFVFVMAVAVVSAFTIGSDQEVVVRRGGYVTYVFIRWWVWLIGAVGVESLETRRGKWAFVPSQVAAAGAATAALFSFGFSAGAAGAPFALRIFSGTGGATTLLTRGRGARPRGSSSSTIMTCSPGRW